MTTPRGDRPAILGPSGAGIPADPAVLALAGLVERTGRRVEALDTLMAQLAADVAALARAMDARTRPSSGAPGTGDDGAGVRSWLLADDHDQAVTDLADLAVWMDRVYLRYRDAAVPSCWLWHPEVIEELWWLRCAHADAYHPDTGSWLRAGDWHDRQRPGVVRRITRAVGSCELALHLTESNPGRLTGASSYVTAPAPAPLTTAVAQVAAVWVTDGSTPEPDAEQLAESERLSGRPSGGWR